MALPCHRSSARDLPRLEGLSHARQVLHHSFLTFSSGKSILDSRELWRERFRLAQCVANHLFQQTPCSLGAEVQGGKRPSCLQRPSKAGENLQFDCFVEACGCMGDCE